jgi:hypothetical protein
MSSNNATGKSLENQVESILNNQSYVSIEHKNWIKTQEINGKLLVKHFPYTSIYETKCRTEFVLIDNGRKIRIECKWQQVSGSVDEKFPYLYWNAVEKWEENESILLVDGGGYKPKALEWLRKSARNRMGFADKPEKAIAVFTFTEFMIWVNKGMKDLRRI